MTEPSSPLDAWADRAALADKLVGADDDFLRELKARRASSGLSTAVIAERMGVTVEAVEQIERYDSDPSLSQLRRYALAAGITYSHAVAPEHEALPPL